MTSNRERAELLASALRALVEPDRRTLTRVLAIDVRVWTPEVSAESRQELLDALERRDEAFSEIAIRVTPLDVGGNHACSEWTVSMVHSGPIEPAEGTTIEPTGLPIELHGVTVAEFIEDEICSLRQYWDGYSLLDQLGDRSDDR